MKQTASPLIVRPGSIRKQQRSNFDDLVIVNHENSSSSNPALGYVVGAAKRLSAVFSMIFRLNKEHSDPWKDQVHTSKRRYHAGEESYSLKGSPAYDTRTSSSSRPSNYDDKRFVRGNLAFQEIYKATGNFSAANKIGEGGFGTVYRGELNDGSVVAVKRAKKKKRDECLIKEFKSEIMALSKLEHRNLVRFYGYLEYEDELLIVVEYVSNGTLRQHLDGTGGNVLEIAERLNIAIDIAHAMTYLHNYTDPPIIHRDIKASNILITQNLGAKVADFGFARLGAEDSMDTHISTEIKGTAGYLDPEYLRTYQLTEKSDVYSFGVLLVEIMSGRHPFEPKREQNERVTTRWALRRLRDGEVVLAMDPRLQRNIASLDAVKNVMKLARKCLSPSRLLRPSMKQCAEKLWEIRKEFEETTHFHARESRCDSVSAIGCGDSLMFVSQ